MQLNFNAADVAPQQQLQPLPAGWYPAIITGSEGKATKESTAAVPRGYLQLTFDIIDGEFKGRKVFARLNLQNPNVQTVEIANGQLSAICHAVGVIQMRDTEQLHGKPLLIKVSLKKDPTGEYEPSNDVKMYKGIEGATPSAGAGIGGSGAGVPDWAARGTAPVAAIVQNAAAPTATPQATGFAVPQSTQPVQPVPGTFGALSAAPAPVAETPAVAVAGPAATATPSWALPAK